MPAMMSSCGGSKGGMGHYMAAWGTAFAMGAGAGGGGGGPSGGGSSSSGGGAGGNSHDHQGAKVPTRSQSGDAGAKQGKYGRE